ncbi:MAG: ferrochelatase [Gammaproteobacteria bacterium]|nr:ferrochelatase [Gammaproteobacteria bacterium]
MSEDLTSSDTGSSSVVGVLLVNLGTPDAPTRFAVRRYLKEFLSDPRVIEYPRWLWWLILNLVILNVRPARSAKAYQEIWTDHGSPLLCISRNLAQGLQRELHAQSNTSIMVALAMRYGEPSVRSALQSLRAQRLQRLLVVPMYPQYSGTTTGSVFDAVADELKKWRWVPELRMINAYHDNTEYIRAIAAKITSHWRNQTPAGRLVFSFHGLPKRYFMAGDPYYGQCHKTAELVANLLGLDDERWCVAFQSRFGREEWLQPYTDAVLLDLAARGVRSVDLVCPGFAVDCLETLEEIDQQNRRLFMNAGGERFSYIPCLNEDAMHISMLAELVLTHVQGWHARVTSAWPTRSTDSNGTATAVGNAV